MVQMLIAKRETREEDYVDGIQWQKERALSEKEEASRSHMREPKLDASGVKRYFKFPGTDIHVAIL